jgi:hypothetical protein
MARAPTDPTIPTDQEAILAREATRILDASNASEGALCVGLMEPGGSAPATAELPASRIDADFAYREIMEYIADDA